MPEENKTKIRLEIDKTIQPKRYEPIKIIVDIEETFYWKNDKDRAKKLKFHTEKLTEDFVTTFDHVAESIGEGDRCIGKVIASESNFEKEKIKVVSSDKDEEWDFS